MFHERRYPETGSVCEDSTSYPLPRDVQNLRDYTKRAEEILKNSEEFVTLPLEPNAWMEAFGVHSPEEQQKVNNRLIARIRLSGERAEEETKREETSDGKRA